VVERRYRCAQRNASIRSRLDLLDRDDRIEAGRQRIAGIDDDRVGDVELDRRGLARVAVRAATTAMPSSRRRDSAATTAARSPVAR